MRTVRLTIVRTSVVTRCQYQWGGGGAAQWGPTNKFEQISRDGLQMSLAEGPTWRGPHVPCLEGDRARGVPCQMSGGRIRIRTRAGRGAYSEVHASWVMVTWGPPVDRQTRLKTSLVYHKVAKEFLLVTSVCLSISSAQSRHCDS